MVDVYRLPMQPVTDLLIIIIGFPCILAVISVSLLDFLVVLSSCPTVIFCGLQFLDFGHEQISIYVLIAYCSMKGSQSLTKLSSTAKLYIVLHLPTVQNYILSCIYPLCSATSTVSLDAWYVSIMHS